MIRRIRAGFTIVEMMIVVVVIAILAIITSTIYANVQVQARDAQVADAADKLSDALRLYIVSHGNTLPKGGDLSTTAISSGTCADGNSSGFVAPNSYACTLGDVLIANNYLPSDFFTKLPANTRYTNTTGANLSLMFYDCKDGSRGVVYFSQEDPTAQATTAANNAYAQCPFFGAGDFRQYNTWGMRSAIVFTYA